MKNAFILTIIALTVAACSPKTAKGPNPLILINKTFNQLVSATNTGDFTKMLDFTYPKVFDMQPRAQMEQMFSQMSAMGISQKLDGMNISNLSEFVTEGTQKFAKAKLTGTAKVNITEKAMIEPMMMQMKTMYSADKLTKTDEGVDIAVDDELYIIQDTETKKMFFLQADPQVKPMLGQLLPATVLEKLNK